jgi:hypothetical protein
MVMVEGNRLTARPLVHTVLVPESTDDLVSAGKVDIAKQLHTLQPATDSMKSAKKGAEVFVVDPGSATGPRQIVATRPQ